MVSVIVCLYNGRRFLREALRSAIGQSDPDFEVIVVDDGSTDGSAEIAESIGDSRIRVVRQANRGAAAAMAAGIREARGDYVAFLDQDDLWEPRKLARHVEQMDSRPEIALTFSWFRYSGEDGRGLGIGSARHRGAFSFEQLLADFVIGATSNAVARRSAIERACGIDLAFPRLYDVDLFLRLAMQGPAAIEAVPEELVSYRRHAGQMSGDFSEMEREWERLMEKMRGLRPDAAPVTLGVARVNIRRYFARLAYEHGNYRRALQYVAAGFSASPLGFLGDRRNWLTAAACASGALLPAAVHGMLERFAGLRRAS